MSARKLLIVTLLFAFSTTAYGQDDRQSTPVELEVIKRNIGVWDAEIEVWPSGLDAPSITFSGVETNRAYGEYWLSSDFESEFMGQTISLHSIVGYDLEAEQLIGYSIDEGPYRANMTGEYDPESKAVTWITKVKMPDGTPMEQKTVITPESEDVRVLVLMMPGASDGEFSKYMQITFTRQQD